MPREHPIQPAPDGAIPSPARPAQLPTAPGLPAGLLLSEKYKAFLRCNAPVEFLEGTTAAGKTTVALFKFMLRVAQSPRRGHVLAGLDQGTVEKNILTRELGILQDFGDLVHYCPAGAGPERLPHLKFATPLGERIIYVLGYADRARWKKALGGQYGCVYIDEINVADMDFVREAAMRCDYLLATLNPDDPALPVYREYINRARPLPEWEAGTPPALRAMLNATPMPGWVHWFFGFGDNPGLSERKYRTILANAPRGTKLYQNKVLGLRTRAAGLVFDPDATPTLPAAEAHKLRFVQFTAGVDTAYSPHTADAFAFVFGGLCADGRFVVLDVRTHNNRGRARPLSPSDLPPLLEQWLAEMRQQWGFVRSVYIDSADAATLLECEKHRRETGGMTRYLPAHKKTPIVDRLRLQSGWMARGAFLLAVPGTRPLLDEMAAYCWRDDTDAPQDGGDHCINAAQYAWLPWKERIGTGGA